MYGILLCLFISVMVFMHGSPPPKRPILHLHGTVFTLLSVKIYI